MSESAKVVEKNIFLYAMLAGVLVYVGSKAAVENNMSHELTGILGVSVLWVLTFARMSVPGINTRERGIRIAYHNLTSVLVPLVWSIVEGPGHIHFLMYVFFTMASIVEILGTKPKVIGKKRGKHRVPSAVNRAHYISIILLWGLSTAVKFLIT